MFQYHGGKEIFILSSVLRFWSAFEVAFKVKALNCQTWGCGTLKLLSVMIAGLPSLCMSNTGTPV